MDLQLHGLRALVIAASRGLGAATAQQFSMEGAAVAICSRNEIRIQETANRISKATGNPVYGLVGDISNPEDAALIVTTAAEAMGGLDILVTNSGGPPAGAFTALPATAWEEAVQLTLMSTVNLIQAAVPYLKNSAHAAILTITSYSAKQPIPNLVLSNSIRGAVIGLTKTLANELGPDGIRVNSIMPGWTMTERVTELLTARAKANDSSVDEEARKQVASLPLRRMAQPDEFGKVAAFLCSPAASYIHGTMVPVDGGAILAAL